MTQQEEIKEILLNLTSHYAVPSITAQEALKDAASQIERLIIEGKIDTHNSAVNTLTQQWHNSKKIEWHQDQIRSLKASLKGKS